jgi:adenylate cyclase
MPRFVAKILDRTIHILLKHIVLVLTVMLCIAAGIALSNMTRLSSQLIETQAAQNAALYVQSLTQAIEIYTTEASDRAKTKGVQVSHDYLTKPGAIPLPSTFAIRLGDQISDNNPDISVRLYSDHPFPWRKAKGGARDDFEREALTGLRLNPKAHITRLENDVFRYAEASVMKSSCVACHNTEPRSTKKDWEAGDVAGVWEISQPIGNLKAQVRQRLQGTLIMLGGISAIGLSGLTLVIGRLRQTARELEHRVRERTTDLAQANTDLEKRNQLIRQVFGRYLSDGVVARLLESPEGLKLGGDRRKITILTSDLRGFTALSERLSPEDVIDILNLYLERMADVINQYQGTIDEFMGDGILVLFGAPVVKDDDALRAVACACAMQLEMGAVNQKMKALGLPPLAMGIGINTGEVVVGNIGSEKRTKYGIVGNQVNLTYRIESYTSGGQILISEQTFQEVKTSVKIAGQKQVQPKGMKQPITIYDVYGIGGLYNLYLLKEEEIFIPISKEIPLQYTLLQEKQIGNSLVHGHLVKLSPKGGEIRIDQIDRCPPALANLKFNLFTSDDGTDQSEDCYAKVLDKPAPPSSFYIHFTSLPPVVQTQFEMLYASSIALLNSNLH